MKSIELPAGNFTVKLISEFTEDPKWISVFLQKDKEMIKLGVEGDNKIVERFLPFLNQDSLILEAKEPSIIEGVVYKTITILFEGHTILFGRWISKGLEIHIRTGQNVEPLTTITISPEECQIWVQKLNELLN